MKVRHIATGRIGEVLATTKDTLSVVSLGVELFFKGGRIPRVGVFMIKWDDGSEPGWYPKTAFEFVSLHKRDCI